MTIEEFVRLPREQRIGRLALTPDASNWAAVEVLCHLRDTEESFLGRFRQVMTMDEPRFVRPVTPPLASPRLAPPPWFGAVE